MKSKKTFTKSSVKKNLVCYIFFLISSIIQAGTKCIHDRNRARLVHAIALTVHDKSTRSFNLIKKIVICFDSCKFLLLTYLSQKKEKDFKTLSHSLCQATVGFHSVKNSSSNYC